MYCGYLFCYLYPTASIFLWRPPFVLLIFHFLPPIIWESKTFVEGQHNKLYWKDKMEGDEGVILFFRKALMNVVSQTFNLRGSGGSTKQLTEALFVPHYCCAHFPWLWASGIVSNIYNWANAAFPGCRVTDKQMNLQRNAMNLSVWVHKLSQLFTTRKIRLHKWSRFFESD